MLELFQYQIFINALLAAALSSISCGIVGAYIVSRRMVFISGGITHASFGGIGLGIYLGVDPVLCAAIFAILSAILIELFAEKSEIREDSMIGILWAFGMALGIIFIRLTPGYVDNVMGYLFGSIAIVSNLDLYMMAALTALVISIFCTLFKEILYVAFDEEYARTQKVPAKTVNCILICLVALTIVINIRVVGIILVISLLTIPQAIAGLFSKNFRTIIFYSIGFSFLSSITGLIGSYKLDLPPGACIVFLSVLAFILASIARRIYTWIKVSRKLDVRR